LASEQVCYETRRLEAKTTIATALVALTVALFTLPIWLWIAVTGIG
jgi:hypothetical protein